MFCGMLKPMFSAETDGSTNCCHCCSCQSTWDSGPADISNGHISEDGSMCYETAWCGTVIAIWIHYCKIWFINTLDDKACLARHLSINRCQSGWQNSVFVHCNQYGPWVQVTLKFSYTHIHRPIMNCPNLKIDLSNPKMVPHYIGRTSRHPFLKDQFSEEPTKLSYKTLKNSKVHKLFHQ